MLGQNYFEKRLGDIYQYSRIPYISGKGRTNQSEYFWELCVDSCGNIIFILSSFDSLQKLDDTPKIAHVSGVSEDDVWNLNCTNVHILAREVEVSKEQVLFCLPSSIVLTRKEQLSSRITLAKAYFSNFDFFRVDCERGFFANIGDKKLCFQTLETHKKLVDLIDIDRIPNALLSQVSIPVDKDESISTIEDEARSISWFLSLLNLDATFIPIIEYYSDSEIIQYSLEDTVKNSFCRSYIIDNVRIDGGIPKAFESCYESYKNWQAKIDINTLIGFLVEINQQKYIDLKLAVMIMAYENLLLKYLLNQGLTQDQIQEPTKKQIGENIQQKLRQINTFLRFIPSDLMDDTLRDSVRNPLFHQGEIPLLTISDKRALFKRYYDLLIRIILRILGYTGQYMSIVTHSPALP